MTTAVARDEGQSDWLKRLPSLERKSEPVGDDRMEEAVMNTVCALATGEAAYAKRTSFLACSLDADGSIAGFTGVVARGVADIETAGSVQAGTWDRLEELFADGPLSSLIPRIRTA